MSNQTVLISGAGIAGPTLAYWLARHRFRPTVVERAAILRSSGSPVDVRGRAVDVAERMGVMARIRDAGTDRTGMSFVNATGRRVGGVNTRACNRRPGAARLSCLAATSPRSCTRRAGTTPSSCSATPSLPLATTSMGSGSPSTVPTPRRFDLVIGADGLHSAVPRLAFGPEPDFVQHLGLYVATMRLDGLDGLIEGGGREVVMYNTPGRAVAIHPSRGHALAFFAFRSPAVPDFDYRDTAQHKQLLAAAFADAGWRMPELLKRVQAADDLYFDSVSQVRVRPWWHGRGRAGWRRRLLCVAVRGRLQPGRGGGVHPRRRAGGQPRRPPVGLPPLRGQPPQAGRSQAAEHRAGASLLIPATRPGILARNLATRLWPVGAAAGWLRCRLAPAS